MHANLASAPDGDVSPKPEGFTAFQHAVILIIFTRQRPLRQMQPAFEIGSTAESSDFAFAGHFANQRAMLIDDMRVAQQSRYQSFDLVQDNSAGVVTR